MQNFRGHAHGVQRSFALSRFVFVGVLVRVFVRAFRYDSWALLCRYGANGDKIAGILESVIR